MTLNTKGPLTTQLTVLLKLNVNNYFDKRGL